MSKINSTGSSALKVNLSLKYQVLCDQTAMVGVIKQEQTSAEVKEINVNLNEDQFASERLEKELAKKRAEEEAKARAERQARMAEQRKH